MRVKIIHEAKAWVTLTDRERTALQARRVPMIYSPGGMGPGNLEPGSNVVTFGGPCYVDPAPKLDACLAQFRAAIKAAMLATGTQGRFWWISANSGTRNICRSWHYAVHLWRCAMGAERTGYSAA